MSGRFRLAPSPLVGVTDVAWNRFLGVMHVQAINAVSTSGGFGCFDLRPRRLAEIRIMRDVKLERRSRDEDLGGKRAVYVGEFVSSTREAFLNSFPMQLDAFVKSNRLYDIVLRQELHRPEGVSRSGALAILHRGGKGALATWPEKALEETKALFERANLIF